MKKHRWAISGVDYETILTGGLLLVLDEERLVEIAKDHESAIKGGMFFTTPDSFSVILDRLKLTQDQINQQFK